MSVMNNSSLFTADRMTHLKVVAVALIFATIPGGHRHSRSRDRSNDDQ